jgi:hypothetical protein|uniref:Uncharacterized protein n=1 Tax=Siphoviridae sp. ctyg07 TaxID=2825747 RepID=A0A8S5VCG9_9CAUD|nr:MAG TPA: hypothetical protein [Siphoviridae sp. ctyg07]
MKWNDISAHEKGRVLNTIGVTMCAGLAVIASITVLVIALLFAPWIIKIAAGIILLSCAFLAGGAYYETR